MIEGKGKRLDKRGFASLKHPLVRGEILEWRLASP